MELRVATITRARGLRGEVGLEIRTDQPAERLEVGTTLRTEPPEAGPLTVQMLRQESKGWLASFDQVTDRDAAEALRGVHLVVDITDSDEQDAWYPHELVGLVAQLPDGTVAGEVTGLEHLPAHDCLVIREPGGVSTMVPLVTEMVPSVDVEAGVVVLDPPGGLLAARPATDDDDAGAPASADLLNPGSPEGTGPAAEKDSL